MPRVIEGAVTSGELGPGVVRDGVHVYGGTAWLDADRTLNQNCATGVCTLDARDIHTGEQRTIDPRASTFVLANGRGAWAAFLPGVGSYTSTGKVYPYVGAIGPAGELAIKLGGAGPWQVLEPNGDEWILTNADAFDLQLLGQRRAIWRPGPEPTQPILTRGCPVPVTIGPAYGVQLLEIDGQWWAQYQSGRVVLHPVDSPIGYNVTLGASYGRDLCRLAATIVRCVWADNPSQAPSSVRVLDIDIAAARTDLRDKPPIDPPDDEDPSMDGITDAQFATLQRLRAKLPATLTERQIGALLNEWAWTHRAEQCGLQAKPSGTGAIQPRTGTRIWNGARFVRDGKHFGQDVLASASVGIATPVRGTVGDADAGSFVLPVLPLDDIDDPPVDDTRLASLEKAVELLTREVGAHDEALMVLTARVNVLEGKVKALEDRQPEKPTLPKLRVRGNVGRTFGHSHTIDLPVVPE